MKIAFVNCRKSLEKCTMSGCFNALSERKAHFESYEDLEVQVVAATDCSGCENMEEGGTLLEAKMIRFRQIGVNKIHFGACVCKEGKCPHFEKILQAAEKMGLSYELGTH